MYTVVTCWTEQFSVIQYGKLEDAMNMFNASVKRAKCQACFVYLAQGEIETSWTRHEG
jgi:hypothetical protein